MNREIIFRGKTTDSNEWVYGWLAGENMICNWNAFKVKVSTVGQYTGQKDKNGKNIFEGDIVRDKSGETGYIGYLLQECGFVIIWKDRDSRLGHRARNSGYTFDANLEIIGNTYDNPELLKGQYYDKIKNQSRD